MRLRARPRPRHEQAHGAQHHDCRELGARRRRRNLCRRTTLHVLLLNTIVATNTAPDTGPNIDNQPGLSGRGGLHPDRRPDRRHHHRDHAGLERASARTPSSARSPTTADPRQTMALSTPAPHSTRATGSAPSTTSAAPSARSSCPASPTRPRPGADGSDIGAFELQGIAARGAAGRRDARATCRGRPPTIVAQPGVPTVGTEAGDVIVGTDGPRPDRGSRRRGPDLRLGRRRPDVRRRRQRHDRRPGRRRPDPGQWRARPDRRRLRPGPAARQRRARRPDRGPRTTTC